MSTGNADVASPDVAGQILEEFLSRLRDSGVAPATIERLRGVITEQKPTEAAVRSALLSED
jgi:hypothetical protein